MMTSDEWKHWPEFREEVEALWNAQPDFQWFKKKLPGLYVESIAELR